MINYINVRKAKAESGKGRKGKEKRKKNKHHLPMPEINDMHRSLVSDGEKKKKAKATTFGYHVVFIYL